MKDRERRKVESCTCMIRYIDDDYAFQEKLYGANKGC